MVYLDGNSNAKQGQAPLRRLCEKLWLLYECINPSTELLETVKAFSLLQLEYQSSDSKTLN